MLPMSSLIKCWSIILWVFVVMLKRNGSVLGCLDGERVALFRLRDAFNHPNDGPSLLPSWQGLGDCCTWERVICDNSTKRVTYLLLNYTRPYVLSNVQWSLNASHFLPFHELQGLDLSGNYLSALLGSLKLNNLQKLSFRNNTLTKVPSFDLSSGAKLEKLILDMNFLSGSLPEFIQNLTSLKELSFYVNYLNGSLPKEGGLCKLKNLISLDLSINHFVGHIPMCLSNLSSLRLLDISDNEFEGPLPSSIVYALKSLAYVSLASNHFQGSLSLPMLANHSNLQIFELSSYNQQHINVETENPPFTPSFQLKIFKVVNCTLNEPTHTLPTFLYHQHDLRMLHIGHAKMAAKFPTWLLVNNSRLNYFNVSHNLLTGPLEFNSTSRFHNMDTFDVSSNLIGGEIPQSMGANFPNLITLNMSSSLFQGSFPASFGDMTELNNLDMSNNNLSGSIPPEFGKNNGNLRILKISDNNLHGPFLPPKSNFSNLFSLHLANNHFNGNLSNGIWNSRQLRMLDLSNNHFSGEIPSWIERFHNLTFLILSKNSLQGLIPLGFCKLVELSYLDLSHNNLSGTLPNCFKFSYLRFLFLQHNQFSGPIPTSLAKSHDLLTLDLTKNKFSGQIPEWINSLLSLRILLLRENKLGGTITSNLCHLRNISMLDLSRNSLFGSIPSCLKDIAFGKLKLSNGMGLGIGIVRIDWVSRATEFAYDPNTNEFVEGYYNEMPFAWYEDQEANFVSKYRYESYKGAILNFMSGLDFSCNNLTGDIPPEIGNLSGLLSLNLSKNHLTGPIPKTFSNLSQIESLDLSHNMLSGQIPSELVLLYSLSVFSVAYNNLSGKTPERTNQFGTFEATSYEGNPFLCGAPLHQNCSPVAREEPQEGMESPSHGKETEFRDSFVWSFVGTFIVAFLGVILYLYLGFYFFIPRRFRK